MFDRKPVLLGFADLDLTDQEAVGIAAPPAKSGQVKVQAGMKVTVPPPGKSPHKLALTASAQAGVKAVNAAKTAARKVNDYKKQNHKPLVPIGITAVHGGQVILGATANVPLTDKQRKAVDKHTNAIAKTAMATRRLNVAASVASKAGNDANAFTRQAADFLKKKLEGGKGIKVSVRGDALGVDIPSVDGGSNADITNQSGAGGLDPTTGIVFAPDGSVLYDPSQDAGLIAIPDRPGNKLTREEALVPWKTPPENAVVYDGSRGFPEDSLGSTSLFYDNQKNGIIWFPRFTTWGLKSLPGTRDQKKTNNTWTRLGPEQGALGPLGHKGEWRWYETGIRDPIGGGKDAAALARKYNYGLLVGNPNNEITANLQFATETGQWFWQSDKAPKWAVTEADAKIIEANKKTIAANQATALTYAAAIMQEQAAKAEEEAKQEAEKALKEEARQEQLKDLEIEQQKAQAQQAQGQAQIDLQAQQAQIEIAKQQAQADVQTQQAQLEFARQQAQAQAAQQQTQLEIAKQQAQAEAAQQQALIEQANQWNQWAMQNPQLAQQQMQVNPGLDLTLLDPALLQQLTPVPDGANYYSNQYGEQVFVDPYAYLWE